MKHFFSLGSLRKNYYKYVPIWDDLSQNALNLVDKDSGTWQIPAGMNCKINLSHNCVMCIADFHPHFTYGRYVKHSDGTKGHKFKTLNLMEDYPADTPVAVLFSWDVHEYYINDRNDFDSAKIISVYDRISTKKDKDLKVLTIRDIKTIKKYIWDARPTCIIDSDYNRNYFNNNLGCALDELFKITKDNKLIYQFEDFWIKQLRYPQKKQYELLFDNTNSKMKISYDGSLKIDNSTYFLFNNYYSSDFHNEKENRKEFIYGQIKILFPYDEKFAPDIINKSIPIFVNKRIVNHTSRQYPFLVLTDEDIRALVENVQSKTDANYLSIKRDVVRNVLFEILIEVSKQYDYENVVYGTSDQFLREVRKEFRDKLSKNLNLAKRCGLKEFLGYTKNGLLPERQRQIDEMFKIISDSFTDKTSDNDIFQIKNYIKQKADNLKR